MIFHQKVVPLLIKSEKSVRVCYLEQILYIESSGSYSEIRMVDGEILTHTARIGQLEKILRCYGFIRLNRNILFNLKHFVEYTYEGKRHFIIYSNGGQLEIPRKKVGQLKKKLETFFVTNNSGCPESKENVPFSCP